MKKDNFYSKLSIILTTLSSAVLNINENELNVEQTRFINLIKAYIVKNGVIDKNS